METRLISEIAKSGDLDSKLKDEQSKSAELESKLKAEQDKVNKFESEQAIFGEFKSLNEDIKTTLKGIFKLDSFENFIACGGQRSNIDAIWNVIKNCVQSNKFDDLDKLNNLLKYFIDVFNKTTNTPTIKLQEVAIGAKFNPEYFSRSTDSKPAGNITEIYLIGYDNAINGNNINKSIVRVE